MLRGNRADTTTLRGLLASLGRRFGLRKAVFVFDNGMSSTLNLEALRKEELDFVTRLSTTTLRELLAQLGSTPIPSQGLPDYTFERAPGESWRSKFDPRRNVIVVNNGHRDFVYASRSKSLKLRYLVRLYAKELVIHNFVGLPADQLLERMVELSLRTEEHL